MRRQIAYVEDKDATRDRIAGILRDEGFEVTTYSNRTEAMTALRRQLPDLALLDVSHEGERDAGYQLCAELRRISEELPIIFLTSHDGEIDKISGLRLGADDYISKGVSTEYLVIRIHTLFRRLDAISRAGSRDRTAGAGASDIELDEVYSTLHWKGHKIDLPLTHYWIVRDLYLNPGKVRSHRDLMKSCSIVVEPNTIAAHVKAIRAAFCRVDPDFHCIRTERGRGYRWLPG